MTSPDNVAISVTATGDRRIVDLRPTSLLRVLVPLGASTILLGVALIVV